jgi:RimJ/RimL family protein N-acetyltransferase
MVVTIEPITTHNVSVFKAVRLRALLQDPYAFGSTYAKESQLSDAEWRKRVKKWNGKNGIGFLAIDKKDGVACGMAGSFLDEDDPTRAVLISMWMAPTHRRQGLGRVLVSSVIRWARSRNARVVRLMVVANNDSAIRFYEYLGFKRTGRTQPYPNDPALIEYEMSREIV